MADSLLTINKIVITPEAKFDYEDMFNTSCPSVLLKKNIEDYIGYMQVNKYFTTKYYFRCVWFDKTQNKDLMLFFL